MRLIDTSLLCFRKIADFDVQNAREHARGYAILSHRWGEEGSEVDFDDLTAYNEQSDDVRLQRIKAKPGWSKLLGACHLARSEGYDLIWIDTCCIDKRDSVELGEAINSMYRWYAEAQVCFVHLADVDADGQQFEESSWFDRGWTLQELIAPEHVYFYDRAWELIGSKRELHDSIEHRTGIPMDILLNSRSPSSSSVAQRMSWAAKRQTARIEDRAYSLMGLFDVNMPMIYGERGKAFIRLQEEIIKKNGDLSIFAWNIEEAEPMFAQALQDRCGLLAPTPACFAQAGDLLPRICNEDFGIGQRGLSVTLESQPYALETYLAYITSYASQPRLFACIVLARLPGNGQFARIRFPSQESLAYVANVTLPAAKRFHVRQETGEIPRRLFPGFWLRSLEASDQYDCDIQILSRTPVPQSDRVSFNYGALGTTGIVRCELRKESSRSAARYFQWMKFGFDKDSNPICLLVHQNSVVTQNVTLKVNSSAFAKAMEMSSAEREKDVSGLFRNDWMQLAPRQLSMMVHAIRGDRENGIDVLLSSKMGLTLSIKRCPDPLAGSAGPVAQEIWTVDLKRLPYHASSPKATHGFLDKMFGRGTRR